MATLHPLETSLAAAWPPQAWSEVTVLLAVSGGADSVALLRAMAALKTGGEGRFHVAHLNHHLRDDASAEDEAFVIELCRELGLNCEVGHAPVRRRAAEEGDGLEAAARAARYEFLQHTAARLGARYVVTAHTADDQAETILHRIFRGTGIGGLAGMARVRPLLLPLAEHEDQADRTDRTRQTPAPPSETPPSETPPNETPPAATLIRPLLRLRRAALRAYLDDLGQPYRSDSSNDDVRFTRNRIRRELLPQLAERFNPGVVEALLRLGSLAGEVQTVVDALVDELAGQCVLSASSDVVEIDAEILARQPRYVSRELLMAVWRERGWPMQAMGFAQWDQLADMVLAGRGTVSSSSKQTFPGGILAEVRDGRMVLRRIGH